MNEPKPVCNVPGLRFYSADELRKLPGVAWLVKNVLPDRALAVLYGQPGAGKTFLGLDLALCLSAGLEWAGRRLERTVTLYAAGEDLNGVRDRVEAWKQVHPEATEVDDYFYVVTGTLNLAGPQGVEAFITMVREELLDPPSLVIFDTLAMWSPGVDENSAKEMGLVVRGLRRIVRELKCTVMVIHHTTKQGTGFRGSSSFQGAADTMFRVDRKGDGFVLNCTKQRNASALMCEVFALEPVGSSAVAIHRSAGPGSGLDDTDLQILDVLEDEAEGLTAREIVARTGIAQTTAYNHLRALVDRDPPLMEKWRGRYCTIRPQSGTDDDGEAA